MSIMCEVKTCSYCGKELIGRTDKKYCDDNCRNNHHYRIKNDNASLIRNINDSLLFNRNILKILCKGKKTMLKKQQLLNRGFDFEMMTNVYHTKKNEYYIVVYDYAYRFISEEEILLIKYL